MKEHLNYTSVTPCISTCLFTDGIYRYRDGIDEKDQLIQWLWETLTSFTNEEKTQFLRFVSGRSRLPARVSEITQRFQIVKWGRVSDQFVELSSTDLHE